MLLVALVGRCPRARRLVSGIFAVLTRSVATTARERGDARSPLGVAGAAPLSRSLAAAAMLSLALGMGANTALFSVVDALLLRPLPVRQPDRLVTVSSGFALSHGFKAGAGMNYDIWTRMRERALGRRRSRTASPGPRSASISRDGGEMQPADALFASGGFFTTLGVPAAARPDLHTPPTIVKGGGPDGLVAVISYRLWQRRFDGAAGVIGTALPVDGVRCTVIGVMPPDFFGIEVGQPFDVALPLAAEPVDPRRACLAAPSVRADVDRDVPAEARTVARRGDGDASRDAAGHSRALRRFAARRCRRC